MPPATSGKDDALKETKVFQAVLIADSFNNRFQPLTQKTPRVLLPLINRPLIDYTLRLLKLSDVQEVYVFCSANSNLVRAYIKEHWPPGNGLVVHVNSSENYLSVGDVLRDVDQKGLIKSDFILIHGDVIGNLQLLDILDGHR